MGLEFRMYSGLGFRVQGLGFRGVTGCFVGLFSTDLLSFGGGMY